MSILDKLTNRVGETITFFSYKGGNGRTMALSNVATLLAQQNPKDKILMIDWDLEAPGLHRFFFQESLFTSFTIEQFIEVEKNVSEGQGLIDLFIAVNNMLDAYSIVDDSVVRQVLNNVNSNDYIISTSLKNLFILKAGRFDKQYSDKVNTFNWENLYNKAPSLIRLFSEDLTKQYKYVLIDSRTGFTDISGICTMLLPQKLVVVFTPNNQSYTGIKDLILKATTYRRKSNDIRPLLVYPLPSRIEFSRDDLRAYWRHGNPEKKITGYQNMFQDIFKDVYGLDECNLTEYFEQVQIQQSPNYAYGEEIAVISEKTKDSFSLSKSYEIFTQWLIDSNPPWESKQSEESSNVNTSAAIDFESIGLELENKGEYEKALSYYYRSLAIYEELNNKKELAQIHNKIGILLKNLKRYDDAVDNHQKALDIHLNIKDQLNIAKDYTNIASIFENRSEYDQALQLYDEAIKINPNNFEIYLSKGKILEKLKRFEEAIRCYDQVIRIDPDNVDALNQKGNILYNQGKYEDIDYFNKLLFITLYKGKCVPFVGQAVCQPWIPLDRDIAIKWARENNYPLEDSYQLSRVAQFLSIQYDDSVTKDKLKSELEKINPPNFSIDQFRNEPLSVLADLNLPLYITTNYDHFLEEALRSKGKEPISDFCRWNEELMEYANVYEINSNLYDKDSGLQITPANPLVYHLLGDMDHPQSMVLTEKDYIDFVIFLIKESEKVLPRFLRQTLTYSSLLFIGYSLGDISFNVIFQTGLTFLRNKKDFAVMLPYNEDYNEDYNGERLKKYTEKYAATMFKIQIHWNSIRKFMQELQFRWEELKNKPS